MSAPRELTPEECRERLLCHIWRLIDYWAAMESRGEPPESVRERLAGLTFSILSTLDGESLAMPAMAIVTAPPKGDDAFDRKNGENWWPTGVQLEWLHEHFHACDPARSEQEKST